MGALELGSDCSAFRGKPGLSENASELVSHFENQGTHVLHLYVHEIELKFPASENRLRFLNLKSLGGFPSPKWGD